MIQIGYTLAKRDADNETVIPFAKYFAKERSGVQNRIAEIEDVSNKVQWIEDNGYFFIPVYVPSKDDPDLVGVPQTYYETLLYACNAAAVFGPWTEVERSEAISILDTIAEKVNKIQTKDGLATQQLRKLGYIWSDSMRDWYPPNTISAPPVSHPFTEEHIRFCPECGTIGPLDGRPCCPDSGSARHVPKKFAEKCKSTWDYYMVLSKEEQDKKKSNTAVTGDERDRKEFAELQTYLKQHHGNARGPYPHGLAAWALNALKRNERVMTALSTIVNVLTGGENGR